MVGQLSFILFQDHKSVRKFDSFIRFENWIRAKPKLLLTHPYVSTSIPPKSASLTSSDLLSIAEEFGTPLFVYDSDVISENIQRLRHAFPDIEQLHLHYAAKALTTLPVLQLIRKQGVGLDCVSVEEVELGLKAGFTPDQIMFTPNGVSTQELLDVHHKGIRMNIDSLPALEAFTDHVPNAHVCIRINPHIMAGGNQNISVGHEHSKFGVSVAQLDQLLALVESRSIRVNGVHMHTGSEIKDISQYLQACDVLFDVAKHFTDLEFLDFGSGFKIPYFPGDTETPLDEFGHRLTERFHTFCADYGKPLQMVFEPGKFIVSNAGHFLMRVNAVKKNPTRTFAQVDSGLNHFIRPMLYGSRHSIENLSAQSRHPLQRVNNPQAQPEFANDSSSIRADHALYSVVGYICETDTFADDVPLPETVEGDILRLANAGAYGMMMASNYNSRLRPAEVLWMDGKARLIRRRETLEDLLATQISLPEL